MIGSLYTTVWLKEIEPLVPRLLQRSGLSSVNGGPLSAPPHNGYGGHERRG
jgi:hypothetical protein